MSHSSPDRLQNPKHRGGKIERVSRNDRTVPLKPVPVAGFQDLSKGVSFAREGRAAVKNDVTCPREPPAILIDRVGSM